MLGQFSLGLAITAPIFMFSNLQLQGLFATDQKNSFEFGHYLGLRIMSSTIALVLIIIITIFGSYNNDTRLIILLIGLVKCLESISEIVFGLFQKKETMNRISASLIMKGVCSLALLSSILALSENLFFSVVGLLISTLCMLVFFDLRNAIGLVDIRPILDRPKLWSLLKLSIPMGFVMLLISLNSNIPRYIIEHYLGNEELGYFSALTYIGVAGTTVVSALGQVASPRLAKYYELGYRNKFLKLLIQLIIIAFLVGGFALIVVAMYGKEILTLLYQSSYAQYSNVFLLVMVSCGISYISSFLGYGMTAARFFKVQPFVFLTVVIVNVCASSFFIPRYGLKGSVLALIVASLIQLLLGLVVVIYAIHKCRMYEVKDSE